MVIPTGRLPEDCPTELLKEELLLEARAIEDWYTTDFWAGYDEDEEESMIEEFDWAA